MGTDRNQTHPHSTKHICTNPARNGSFGRGTRATGSVLGWAVAHGRGQLHREWPTRRMPRTAQSRSCPSSSSGFCHSVERSLQVRSPS